MKKTVQSFAKYVLTGAMMLCLLILMPAARAGWVTNNIMSTARSGHAAILLQNGKVLVAGGLTMNGWTNSAELFDPATVAWSSASNMNAARQYFTATLMTNGKVLVSGGQNYETVLASTESFDPVSGRWSNGSSLNTARFHHTATLLPNGQILVTGGTNMGGTLASTELFDPASETWRPTGAMNQARQQHTATLLGNGVVLVAGGYGTNGTYLASAEIYNPATGLWLLTNSLNVARFSHTATLLPGGKVLVTGGAISNSPYQTASTEVFDPVSGTWSLSGSLTYARQRHTATLLPCGLIMACGGYGLLTSTNTLNVPTPEVYNPATGTWSTTNANISARNEHTATLLPNGSLLLTGGNTVISNFIASTVETYSYVKGTNLLLLPGSAGPAWYDPTATLLPNGQLLVAGGVAGNGPINLAETFDSASETWSPTGTMNTARTKHTATMLPGGQVLVTGGYTLVGDTKNCLNTAELFDPTKSLWTVTNALNVSRENHTATLLPNGKVLVAGGDNTTNGRLASAELYDPLVGAWTLTGSMNAGRTNHTATLLPGGKVLVTDGSALASTNIAAELYDPVTGAWSITGPMSVNRANHTATLLPNGNVLVTGGYNLNTAATGSVASAEIYLAASGKWTNAGVMSVNRAQHTATLLPNGKVLITGGYSYYTLGLNTNASVVTNVDLFDPLTSTWTTLPKLNTARYGHVAALLNDRNVLIASGANNNGGVGTVELWNLGLGYTNTSQPQITGIIPPLGLNSSLVVTGTQFRGVAEGSGGSTQDSATDYPLVELHSLVNDQTTFLPITNWTATSLSSAPVTNFPPGWALATIIANGIPGTSSVVNISVPVAVTTTIISGKMNVSRAFQLSFTNTPGALLGVLATTNVAAPLSNWTKLSGVTESPAGQFQFVDYQATNTAQRYYRVFAP